MLSKLKGMLGMKKGKSTGGRGVVGSCHDADNARSDQSSSSFEVTFRERSLGLSVAARESDGKALVVDVADGSPAFRAGVRPGQLLTHLDGNVIESFDSFNAISSAIGRPVVLR